VRSLTAAVGGIAGQAVGCEWAVNDLHAATSALWSSAAVIRLVVSGRCMAFSRAVSAQEQRGRPCFRARCGGLGGAA
jgi:hypothetical protein